MRLLRADDVTVPGLDFSWLDGDGNDAVGSTLRDVAGTALGSGSCCAHSCSL